MKWDRVPSSISGLGGVFFNREKQFFKMNPGKNLNYMGNNSTYWEWYDVFNPYIMINDHSYGGKHLNGIIELTNKWWIRPQHHGALHKSQSIMSYKAQFY